MLRIWRENSLFFSTRKRRSSRKNPEREKRPQAFETDVRHMLCSWRENSLFSQLASDASVGKIQRERNDLKLLRRTCDILYYIYGAKIRVFFSTRKRRFGIKNPERKMTAGCSGRLNLLGKKQIQQKFRKNPPVGK